MHIRINFVSEKDIILPIHYNHLLQGFIYSNIDNELAEFLHNHGYIYKGRSFKLFTFSNILNRGHKVNNTFNFKKNINLIISSPIEEFCKSLANSMIKNNELLLGENIVRVEHIQIENQIISKEEIVVCTLSPIVVYSTLYKPDGSKYTCYFSPGEPDFERIISENLIKKYKSFNNNDEIFEEQISIKPIGRFKQNLIIYKDFIIKGVSGKFILKGDRRLLQIGVDTGIGSKNSQGLGCITLL